MFAMIVEDDDLLRELLIENLEEVGWRVIGRETAELALSVEDFTPHVLVTDVNLGPGLNGIELASRARERWAHLGIVIISGRPLPRGALLRQAERFIRKPFDLATLITCMHDVLDRRSAAATSHGSVPLETDTAQSIQTRLGRRP